MNKIETTTNKLKRKTSRFVVFWVESTYYISIQKILCDCNTRNYTRPSPPAQLKLTAEHTIYCYCVKYIYNKMQTGTVWWCNRLISAAKEHSWHSSDDECTPQHNWTKCISTLQYFPICISLNCRSASKMDHLSLIPALLHNQQSILRAIGSTLIPLFYPVNVLFFHLYIFTGSVSTILYHYYYYDYYFVMSVTRNINRSDIDWVDRAYTRWTHRNTRRILFTTPIPGSVVCVERMFVYLLVAANC